jgi:hypothetical protein
MQDRATGYTGSTAADPSTVDFKIVFKHELRDILLRRAAALRRSAGIQQPSADDIRDSEHASLNDPVLGELSQDGQFSPACPMLNAVGLCHSGGGVRSAAFCLGTLQAMDSLNVLKRVDYLSTVSGGGYIGASLTAGASKFEGQFPFESRLEGGETPSIKHIRNYSNYLMPNGKTDLLHSLVIYLRGIVANIILVLPWILLAAYITVRSNPFIGDLDRPDFLRIPIPNVLPYNHFVLTTYLALFLLLMLATWALLRSRRQEIAEPEVPTAWTRFYGILFLLLVVVAFFDLQPFVLKHVWGSDFTNNLATWLQRIGVALAPLASLVAFFGGQLQAFIKRALDAPTKTGRTAGYLGKALIYAAAAVLPLFLWAVFFQLAWWGIAQCPAPCPFPTGFDDAPKWLVKVASYFFGPTGLWPGRPYPIATFYMASFVILVLLSMLLSPNANSLHRLYRDRLSKAFLFQPQASPPPPGKDLPTLDGFKLSDLDPALAPCHLVNTALNIQGSKHVNRRGRNADFFMFSRNYIGSEATKYVATGAMEKVVPELDLGTAIAISAAAASSNMGAQTIRPLTPTLALLNIRIGFWLRNPRYVKARAWTAKLWDFFTLYFFYELIANLNETDFSVYVTDGGHVENLGAYELLKRRCRVIIVVDAEADPEMTFGSLVTLQRFARIDLGVRINLPWQQIRDATKQVSAEFEAAGKAASKTGPHCAIGEIEYPDGGRGALLYIKSSLTGDENDYVLNYKLRHPLFPHESTGDQFFSEEQFEVYRALGFHATHGLFGHRDRPALLDPTEYICVPQDLGFLDRLFPDLAEPDALLPPRRSTFADWLNDSRRPAADWRQLRGRRRPRRQSMHQTLPEGDTAAPGTQ